MAKIPPLGSGQRFDNLTRALAQRPGVKNPAALAAYIGRKNNPAKFNAAAQAGRRRAGY